MRRSALLDRYCGEIGRDPAAITRSIHLPVSYDEPGVTRGAIAEALDAGFPHIVLGLSAPYPEGVARRVADELIRPSAGRPGGAAGPSRHRVSYRPRRRRGAT